MTTIDPDKKALTVGEVARRSGVAVSTIHFYESKGLIKGWRTDGNQRRYAREVLRHIAIIKVAQRTGIPLETIRENLAGLPEGRTISAKEWRVLGAGWRAELDERIARLQRLRDELDTCIGCGCLSLTDCPLRNPADALGEDSAGAVFLDRPAGSEYHAISIEKPLPWSDFMTDPERLSPDSIAALQARFDGHSRKAQAYYAVMHEARKVLGNDDAADAWMKASQPALDGRTPAELVADGRTDDVLASLRGEKTGAAQ